MNNARRNEIRAVYNDLAKVEPLAEAARLAFAEFKEALNDIKETVENIRDQEQEYIDNLPENLSQSERAQNAEQAVSELDEAISLLEVDDIDADLGNWSQDDVISHLDEAVGL
jgi:septation ring formation regulator EzrA